MTPASLLVLPILETPWVKIDLPPCRQGDRIRLDFKLERMKGGRYEILVVQGAFRVSAVLILEDGRQRLDVESLGKDPVWRAVKKKHTSGRKLGPCVFPRTVVQ